MDIPLTRRNGSQQNSRPKITKIIDESNNSRNSQQTTNQTHDVNQSNPFQAPSNRNLNREYISPESPSKLFQISDPTTINNSTTSNSSPFQAPSNRDFQFEHITAESDSSPFRKSNHNSKSNSSKSDSGPFQPTHRDDLDFNYVNPIPERQYQRETRFQRKTERSNVTAPRNHHSRPNMNYYSQMHTSPSSRCTNRSPTPQETEDSYIGFLIIFILILIVLFYFL